MKEKLTTIFNKVKEYAKKAGKAICGAWKAFVGVLKVLGGKLKAGCAKLAEVLKKVGFLKKLVELARRYRLILSMVLFAMVVLTVILVATLGWNEFVVPICAIVIIDVFMAVLLHKSELWVHGILVVAQVVAGVIISRVPLMVLCVIVYVAAMLALHFGFKRVEVQVKESKVSEQKENVKQEEAPAEENLEAAKDDKKEKNKKSKKK